MTMRLLAYVLLAIFPVNAHALFPVDQSSLNDLEKGKFLLDGADGYVVKVRSSRLDVDLSTRASEATLAAFKVENNSNLISITNLLTGVQTKQDIQTTVLNSISQSVDGIEGLIGTTNSSLSTLNTTTNGVSQAVSAGTNTLSISGAANTTTLVGAVHQDIGQPADVAAASDTGTFSLIALIKRLLTKYSFDFGATPAGIRVASIPGNASGIADFNAGNASAQTPRAVIATDQSPVQVRGPAANGAAVSGNPVLIAGYDGTTTRTVLMDSSGRQVIVGGGGVNTPIGGIVSIQGVTGAQSVPTNDVTLHGLTGSLTEAAPASDTASSGLNGRLQRIAQRLTTMLGYFQITTKPERNTEGQVVRPIPFEPETYDIHAANVAIGNGKSMISVFNAGGSTVIVRVHKIKIYSVQTTAVAGIMADFGLRRITAHSVGTQLTTTGAAAGLIYEHDSNNALNASVTARTGATVTDAPAFNIDRWLWSSDEFGAGAADAETTEHTMAQLIYAWEAKDGNQPYVLRAGEGMHVIQTINSTAGTFDLHMVITQESI